MASSYIQTAHEVDFEQPYGVSATLSMTSNIDQQQYEIIMGNTSLYVQTAAVQAVTSAGKFFDMNNNNVFDVFTVQVTDENGVSWFQNPIALGDFQTATTDYNNRGYRFERNKKYTITVIGVGFPATSVIGADYPVRLDFAFTGLKIASDLQINDMMKKNAYIKAKENLLVQKWMQELQNKVSLGE